MRLFEHVEFEQAVLRAAEYYRPQGLRPAIIEKDYYVSEALRILAQCGGDAVIFKGGTSLSKGWDIIQRFSEDIDIFLDPKAFHPPLGKRAIDRELKVLRDAISAHGAFTFLAEKSKTIGGFGRGDSFGYRQIFGGTGEIAPRVLVEAGTASGREPTTMVQIRSLLSAFLSSNGVSLGAVDETPFPMRLLHFRRTFVEKMFAIHAKVEALRVSGKSLGSYARHYYDLYQLAQTPEVHEMLSSKEYVAIKKDYDEISSVFFKKSYIPPPAMSFQQSAALFPSSDLNKVLQQEYEYQCRLLCYGAIPPWDDVRACFEALRPLL